MNFEERRRLYEASFTDLEDDICDYIIAHKDKMHDIKIVTLAKEFYTVPNTITRLCHKMHYMGFLEMKKDLLSEVKEDSDNSSHDYLTFIHENLELMKKEDFDCVINLFQKSSQVIIFAVGSTAFVAKIFVDTLNAIENKFYFMEYEHELRKQINNENTKKTILFISLSGQTEPGLQLAKDSIQKGHQVVSLTDFTDNPLSQIAPYSLFCKSPDRHYKGSNVTDKMPLLLVLETLFNIYIERDKNESNNCH